MKKLFSIFLSVGILSLLILSSCGDDEEPIITNPDAPTVTAPAAQTADVGATVTLTFTTSVPGGVASVAVTETGGTTTTDAQPAAGATSGDVEVTFTAGTTPGAGSVTVTVTDANGLSDDATAVVSITEQGVTFTVTPNNEFRGPDEDNTTEYPQNVVTGVINQDFTFTNDVVWILNGRVVVGNGATLTIDEGTIIKAGEGQGATSSVLLVARGGTLMADGTATEPIIFTSVQDNINLPGLAFWDGTDNGAASIVADGDGFTSTLPIESTIGLWGGVVILGNAPISSGGGEENQIEGIPVSDVNGLYGGSDAMDNSGSLTYASIRFTGTQLGPGNELQGLTLGGVGSMTTINWVESINSADDGIEIFGGTVNVSNFIVYAPDDDGYDLDEAYAGTIDNFLYIASPGSGGGFSFDSDHALELDGPESTLDGQSVLVNGSLQGGDNDEFADLRDGMQLDISNCYFFNFPSNNRFEIDGDESAANFNAGGATGIVISDLEFNEAHTDGGTFSMISEIFGESGTDGTLTNANTTIFTNGASLVTGSNDPTVGANLMPFLSGWSYSAALTNDFEDFTSIN
ncbi:MAG: hypothetical protein AAFX87_21325 [Bacteroidota bacterium]